jgi:hypothetical protein
MPFSSVLGASSAIKPGVCTSSTRPSAPYVGQMIFETDTNRLVVWSGASWVYIVDLDTPPALELVKTQTIGTTVSSVTVTNAFSSTYDNYRILIGGGGGSANGFLSMTLGSSATQYYTAGMTASWQSASIGGFNSDGGSAWLRVAGYESGTPINMMMDINGPFLSSYTFATASAVKTTGNMCFAQYLHNVASSYTDFTLTTTSGTITGGTIRVYGYRNS